MTALSSLRAFSFPGLVLALGSHATGPVAAQTPPTANFAKLDNLEAEHTFLGAYAIRPMAIDPLTLDLFTLNVGLSKVLHFPQASLAGGPPAGTFQVPAQPVSIRIWNEPLTGGGTARRLVVVCRGDHVAVLLDSATGAILRVLQLGHEPGDLLVDQARNRAFVSCQGARTVLEIDLTTFALATTVYQGSSVPGTVVLQQQEPLRLCFDQQMHVLVAPLCSGNNSAIQLLGNQSFSQITDVPKVPVLPPISLPDEDLLRIDPLAGTVTVVRRGDGTLLFGHEVNPVTFKHWQLNVEALNKDSTRQSEPLLNGDFAVNRLTITDLSGAPTGGQTFFDLDRPGGASPNPAITVSLPIDVQFDALGNGYVLGLATDNVTVLDKFGARLGEWDLPDGSGPRAALVTTLNSPVFDRLLCVYLANTNKIRTFLFNPNVTLPATFAELDLGFDPAPVALLKGRRIFFDANLSKDNRLTCAHCHVEGKSDLIGWNLSNLPKDEKGPLVTQTLFGISRTPPFHWRGERPSLADFNPAFRALLGGDRVLTTEELEQFQTFVFAETPSANPHEHEKRVVSGQAAINGQAHYQTIPVLFQTKRCVDCHAFPNGTVSDIVNTEVLTQIPQQNRFDVAHFLELWRKESVPHPITIGPVTQLFGRLGFGLAHNGRNFNLSDFITKSFNVLTTTQASEIESFVQQWDQGIAPAVHRAVRLEGNFSNIVAVTDLIDQAKARNCDLAAIAFSNITGFGIQRRNFAFEPAAQLFVSENAAEAPLPFDILKLLATAPTGSLTFVGLPPGNARMWIDWDRDALLNLHEAVIPGSVGGEEFKPDSDGDGDPDGHEVFNGGAARNGSILANDTVFPSFVRLPVVEWVNTRVARIVFESDEPTICKVSAQVGSLITSYVGTEFARVHNVLLAGLNASAVSSSLTYMVDVSVTDPSGKQKSAPSFPLVPKSQMTVNPSVESQIFDVHWLQTPTRSGSTVTGQVEFQVVTKDSVTNLTPSPLAEQLVIARVLEVKVVNGVEDMTTARVLTPLTGAATSFSVPQSLGVWRPYGPLLGDLTGQFLISPPTNASGKVSVGFTVTGFNAQHRLVIAVMGVVPRDMTAAFNPLAPLAGDLATHIPAIPLQGVPMLPFSFADTPASKREISIDL